MRPADLLATLPAGDPRRALVERARTALRGATTPARPPARSRREEPPNAALVEVCAEVCADFAARCVAAGLPAPVPEYRFCADRKWRLDFAWPEARVALEVEGWGHRTRRRYTQDLAKYNRLAALGWRLVRCTPRTRESDETLAAIRAALTLTTED